MKASYLTVSLIPAAFCAAPLLANAGQTVSEPIITTQESSAWEFRAEPYAWLTALNGSTTAAGVTTNVDAGFEDIAEVLKFAAALQLEARKDRWGFLFDGFYANLGNSGNAPALSNDRVDLGFKQFLGEFDVLYRVSETSNSYLDLYAGARYNRLDLDVRVSGVNNFSDSDSKDWVDPIIGVRSQWNINDRWYLAGKGDLGGFTITSRITYNLLGVVGYNFTDKISSEIGYRYFDTDYTDGGFGYDIAQAGLFLGLNVNF